MPNWVRVTSYRSPPTRASAAAARYTTPSSSGPTCRGSGRSRARCAASATEVTSASRWFCWPPRAPPDALMTVTTSTATAVTAGSSGVVVNGAVTIATSSITAP